MAAAEAVVLDSSERLSAFNMIWLPWKAAAAKALLLFWSSAIFLHTRIEYPTSHVYGSNQHGPVDPVAIILLFGTAKRSPTLQSADLCIGFAAGSELCCKLAMMCIWSYRTVQSIVQASKTRIYRFLPEGSLFFWHKWHAFACCPPNPNT